MRKLHSFFLLALFAALLAWHWHLVLNDTGYQLFFVGGGWLYWLFVASRAKTEVAYESIH